MKKLVILLVLLVLAVKAFSQTITIDVKEAQSYIDEGLNDFKNVLSEPDLKQNPRSTNCRYVINFNDSTSSFYRNGKFVSEVRINFTEVSPGVYSIYSYDTDTETGELSVTTSISLNTNFGSSAFLYQYYDERANQTIVDMITKFTIVQPV
jgi:hypothetical protein